MYRLKNWSFYLLLTLLACNKNSPEVVERPAYPHISGIYPHLAYYNEEGECGTGAVVPWAGKLWVVTYGPHFPFGSSDKLYEINPDLSFTTREESIGGTPANRMIHRESEQLFIGPYAIDNTGEVRTISYETMPGRHTGNARHLTDPANKIYYGTMEEGFYEVNVHNLETNTLYVDGNVTRKEGEMAQEAELLLGAHGKGLYSGQGVMVYSNNGETGQEALKDFSIEAGALYEWDGTDWHLVRRNQFVEVTGPGGIHGNPNPETDPIWATGWDHKSVILGVRDAEEGWDFYRLPKASHSYDGAHGWNTEWPRIRDVGTEEEPDYLMTMHGMFWKFPGSFQKGQTGGIRPRSAYLKVIGDFTRWQNGLVFGCDDSAQREFLNKRSAKGNIEGPGQSNSNLWFTDMDMPDKLGPATANGALWLEEEVAANEPSEPMLFSGWKEKNVWLQNQGDRAVNFSLEIDRNGTGDWEELQVVSLDGAESSWLSFDQDTKGEWIRVTTDGATRASVHFSFSNPEQRTAYQKDIFEGIIPIQKDGYTGGLLYGLGDNRRKLGIAAKRYQGESVENAGYYEMDEKLQLVKVEDSETESFINEGFAIPEKVFEVDEASVLIQDDQGRRWRLPKGDPAFTAPSMAGKLRIAREVATERDLFNCHGTFYELPAENADGFAKIRPVASHKLRINDYASYRGMLLLSGVDPQAADGNEHIIVSEDGELAVWAGVIDDLWKLGKPVGKGGPWANTVVEAGVPSDPYLFAFYDQRKLELQHDSSKEVTFTIQFEPVGHGPWMDWKEITVAPGQTHLESFPDEIEARWVRLVANDRCSATATFTYE
ncbi:hypothetical protein SAMN04488057_11864 [Cyclobacterium lianum]|uniref:Uncharacterized protein n=1 Tax=Cyclobacterium lianum TaxID=388280 RepID=A0A1M7QIA4_9BACT|nr:hypothetical protein [Cyclobacterium lianum]SHN30655.1 hypothetical protein SAMN04488057_11864 [Cyclobacterium lianum]